MFITIDHRKIKYQWINRTQHTERGPVIVFLHEGLGSIPQWKDFPELLCQQTNMQGLAYEREGYGESSFWADGIPENYLSIEAEDVLPKVLEKLNIKNYFLFGHSDGATLSLYHASIKPQGLKGIVVEAPHVIIEEKTVAALTFVMNLEDPTFVGRLNKYQQGRASKLINHWTSYWMRPKFENWQMIDSLKTIESPTLLIQGEDDDFGSFKQLDTIKQFSPAKIDELRLKDCGHIPHLQQKEEVLNKTTAFFNTYHQNGR